MPNKHAAIKDLRKNRKRATHNTRVRTNVKFLVKKTSDLLKAGKTAEAKEAIRALQQAVDKAAKLGIIKPNKAARKKSSLMKQLSAKKA